MVALGKPVSINQTRAFDAVEPAIFARFMDMTMVILENHKAVKMLRRVTDFG